MGGSINVVSESGSGSEFTFTIPYTDTDIIATEERGVFERADYDFSKSTILIAEDDQSNYILLYEILKYTGAKLIRASDGSEAVELFKENPEINLVLMDIQLPVKNGYEATREIKTIRSIPVIAQTAYAISGEREKSLEAGCDDYISKPIRIGDLLYLLNKYIGQS
jgi:CheY-like chemotaxis protein